MQFKDVIGHEEIKKRLIQTVRESRISHAQLFTGPEGNSKLALAMAYAQFISCTGKQETDSCGICPSCIKYNKLIHPDLYFTYPVSTNKDVKTKPISRLFISKWRELLLQKDYVFSLHQWYEKIEIENKQGIINTEDCNEIIKSLSLKKFESEYRVVIIWMIEKLYHAAAPKLLKILEEPPPKTLFLLISENPDKILKTIISRTQIIKIPKTKDKDIKDYLKKKFDYPETEINKAVLFADGNLINAQKFLENADAEEYNYVNFRNYMLLCHGQKFQEMFNLINEIATIGRERQKSLLAYGLRVIRQSILMNNDNENLVKLEGHEKEFVIKFSKLINSANYLQITEELNKSLFHIERNGNAKIIFADMGLKFSRLIKLQASN
ncbi:MAG: hypothetical protein K9J13_01075 [Saprospiraceae bacterium]|nr:hypothetical protein [Saprospiraceae bacterium]